MAKLKKEKKVFVLDTSVIIYEHNSILNFDEHDVGIPITVLEELDNFKNGNDTKNFEAREFIRLIDKLAKGQMLHQWNPINGKGKGSFKVLMDTHSAVDANKIFNEAKADHRILNAALQLQKEEKNKKVILVSTAGGLHAGQPTGVGHEEFLKVFLGFIGITDLEIVRVHGLAYGEEHRNNAMSAAQAQISNELFAAA
jgi:predicted ribonuclease YlaK